ncbi:hypothetical protein QUA40_15835 [Microcoleus sp. Pol11C3]|uniref:hypothetical protein n=1 Tax=Microcoleus sp. Pol11C3 TaxID=3055390 RepID=UPI002FD351F7
MDIAEVLKLSDEMLFTPTADRPKPIREFRSAIATRKIVNPDRSPLTSGIKFAATCSREAAL